MTVVADRSGSYAEVELTERIGALRSGDATLEEVGGQSGELFIVQARPETVQSRREAAAIRWWRLPCKRIGLGIGLARMEYIINNAIEVHPMLAFRGPVATPVSRPATSRSLGALR